MDYLKPAEIFQGILQAGTAKARLSIQDLLIRGFLSGALLGFATSLAFTATGQTKIPLVGALVFPVGFVLIVLLGWELVTGNFALLPAAWKDGRIDGLDLLRNWTWVFIGNLLGSLFYAFMLFGVLTTWGHGEPGAIAPALVAAAAAKTVGYAKFGAWGALTAFTKAILCNWMVCLGVVAAMSSSSTLGKIVAAWLPVFMFFAQGFEHSVVNMFVIPAGILLGAPVSLSDWWLWNQIPVTLGNIVGGGLFVGFAFYYTNRAGAKASSAPAPSAVPAAELAS